MASVCEWRNCLNNHTISKVLRENNCKESLRKVFNESKGILTTHTCQLYIWDSYVCQIININLKNLQHKHPDAENGGQFRYQLLLCTDPPKFEVEKLAFNQNGSHLALIGRNGLSVVELPQRWGKFGEFEGSKESVTCKTISIAERLLLGSESLSILHAEWHPGSSEDCHLAILTSDGTLGIYDITSTEKPFHTIQLSDTDRSFVSPTKKSFSRALGENPVCFDFGPPQEVSQHRHGLGSEDVSVLLWPVYVVKGNGDIFVVYTDMTHGSTYKLPVYGPLTMYPPAEDNYGNDACSIICLLTTPPVIVVSTCEGKLHHCILLSESCEETVQCDQSNIGSLTNFSDAPVEPTLYVYESVELELSLSPLKYDTEEYIEDDFTCPIKLIKDPQCTDRYHCCHSAGVHTVGLPWIHKYQNFCKQDDEWEHLSGQPGCIVEHLACTKPLPSSPPSPLLGLNIVTDVSLGSTLIALTNEYEFITIALSLKYRSSSQVLVSDFEGEKLPSPLRRLRKEPFNEYIAKVLLRNVSNPLLKSAQKTQLSGQECFQLLTRATQVFREEYIQKQDLARQEIEKRVRLLKQAKEQQQKEIAILMESKSVIQNKAQCIAEKYEDGKENHEQILNRLEQVSRKLQARLPVLSHAEKTMQKDLKHLQEKLQTVEKSIEQLKIKQQFQQRQIQRSQKSPVCPVINKNQAQQIREALKQEGDDISDLMKKISSIRLDATS